MSVASVNFIGPLAPSGCVQATPDPFRMGSGSGQEDRMVSCFLLDCPLRTTDHTATFPVWPVPVRTGQLAMPPITRLGSSGGADGEFRRPQTAARRDSGHPVRTPGRDRRVTQRSLELQQQAVTRQEQFDRLYRRVLAVGAVFLAGLVAFLVYIAGWLR